MLGITATKSMVAIAPVNAKESSKIFLYLPWSAAPDMEMIYMLFWSQLICHRVSIDDGIPTHNAARYVLESRDTVE